MNRRKKKYLTLIIIFFIGFIPLVAIGYYSHWLSSGRAAHEFSSMLSEHSGLNVTLGKIKVDNLNEVSIDGLTVDDPPIKIRDIRLRFAEGMNYDTVEEVRLDGLEAQLGSVEDLRRVVEALQRVILNANRQRKKNKTTSSGSRKSPKKIERIIFSDAAFTLGTTESKIILKDITGEIGEQEDNKTRPMSFKIPTMNDRKCEIGVSGILADKNSDTNSSVEFICNALDSDNASCILRWLTGSYQSPPANLDKGSFKYTGKLTIKKGEFEFASDITAKDFSGKIQETTVTAGKIEIHSVISSKIPAGRTSRLATGNMFTKKSNHTSVKITGGHIESRHTGGICAADLGGEFRLNAELDNLYRVKRYDLSTPAALKDVTAQIAEKDTDGKLSKPTKFVFPEVSASAIGFAGNTATRVSLNTIFPQDNEKLDISISVGKGLDSVRVSCSNLTARLLLNYMPNLRQVFEQYGNPFPITGYIELTPLNGWKKWRCNADIRSVGNFALTRDGEEIVIAKGPDSCTIKGGIEIQKGQCSFDNMAISIKDTIKATLKGHLTKRPAPAEPDEEYEEDVFPMFAPNLIADDIEIFPANFARFLPEGIAGWRPTTNDPVKISVLQFENLDINSYLEGTGPFAKKISAKKLACDGIRLENVAAGNSAKEDKKVPFSNSLLWVQSAALSVSDIKITFIGGKEHGVTGIYNISDPAYGLINKKTYRMEGYNCTLNMDMLFKLGNIENEPKKSRLTGMDISQLSISIVKGDREKIIAATCKGSINDIKTAPLFDLYGTLDALAIKQFRQLVAFGLFKAKDSKRVDFGDKSFCSGKWSLSGLAGDMPPAKLDLSFKNFDMKIDEWLNIQRASGENRDFEARIFQKSDLLKNWAKQFKKSDDAETGGDK